MLRRLGFDLIKWFQDPIPFQVIFITAYQEYAITAIRFAAIDYLLKTSYQIKKFKDDFKGMASFHSSCIFNWAFFKYAVREDNQYYTVLDCETKNGALLKLPVAINNELHFKKSLQSKVKNTI